METEKEILKAYLSEDKPSFARGDKRKLSNGGEIKKVVIRNIYKRKLEDLTFSDLEMIGYDNPNVFVRERISSHNGFDKNKVVWVVVYIEVVE